MLSRIYIEYYDACSFKYPRRTLIVLKEETVRDLLGNKVVPARKISSPHVACILMPAAVTCTQSLLNAWLILTLPELEHTLAIRCFGGPSDYFWRHTNVQLHRPVTYDSHNRRGGSLHERL